MTRVDVKFEDVRAGDLVTLSFEGHDFSGVAWAWETSWGGKNRLVVGTVPLSAYDGRSDECKFVSASREVTLPTGIGAVIKDSEGHYVRVNVNGWAGYGTCSMYRDTDFGSNFVVLSEGVDIDVACPCA